MENLYFSTVIRSASSENAGELVSINWANKQIVQKTTIAPKSLKIDDPNPRGNSRGGRGIFCINETIIVASYCELQVYDKDFNFKYCISNDLMVNLHEVNYTNDNKVWITSTAICAAFQIDINTGNIIKQFWPREMPAFQTRWNLEPLTIDKQVDNRLKYLSGSILKEPSHLHLNAVAVWHDNVFALFNRFGAIVNLSTEEVIFESASLIGAHNLVIHDDGTFFVNDSQRQGVFIISSDGEVVKRINLLPFHQASKDVKLYKRMLPFRAVLKRIGLEKYIASMPFFVRGLDVAGDIMYVGISPASILCINWKESKLVDVYNYSTNNRVAIHGLKVVKENE